MRRHRSGRHPVTISPPSKRDKTQYLRLSATTARHHAIQPGKSYLDRLLSFLDIRSGNSQRANDYVQLRESYSKGSWPAFLAVNSQISDEAKDLILSTLTFQIDIFGDRSLSEGGIWSWTPSTSLSEYGATFTDTALLNTFSMSFTVVSCLSLQLSNVTRLDVRIWFVRKYGISTKAIHLEENTDYISPRAKPVKDKVSLLVCALQEMSSLKCLSVEFERHREYDHILRGIFSRPPVKQIEPQDLENNLH
jgi:hypothetical protein